MPAFFRVANVPLIIAALATVTPAAAVRVLIPNCCNNPAALTVLDPATGRIKAMLNAGPGGPYEETTNFAMALTGNNQAAILSEVGTQLTAQSFAVHLLDLNTSEVVASIAGTGAPVSIIKSPVYPVLYLWYADPATGISHVQELSPDTLDTINEHTAIFYGSGPLIVSPDGRLLFGPAKPGILVLDALTLKPIAQISLPAQSFPVAVSPDSATLYAVGDAASPSLFVIDTQTLQVTNSVPLGSTFYGDAGLQPGALSPDGSRLYLTEFQSILTIDTQTLQIQNVPTPQSLTNVVVSPEGTVYLGVRETAASILVFDPSSQSISSGFRVPGETFLAVSATGGELYVLPDSDSGVAVASASSSGQVQRTGITGRFAGYGTFDPVNQLILLPDYYTGIDVLDANTLEFKGIVPVSSAGLTWLVYGDTVYAAIGSSIEPDPNKIVPRVARLNPITLRVTDAINVPTPPQINSSGFTQPAIEGTNLYVPFNFAYIDCCAVTDDYRAPADGSIYYGIAVVDTTTFTLSRLISLDIGEIIGIEGFAIAPGTGKAYASISSFLGADSLLEIDLDSGAILRSAHIPKPSFLASSPDGSMIYMASNELLAISTDSLAIVKSSRAEFDYLTITPDGKYLCGPVYGGFLIVDTATLQIVASIPAQQNPAVGAPIVLP